MQSYQVKDDVAENMYETSDLEHVESARRSTFACS